MDFVSDNGKEEEPITLIVDESGLTVSRKGHYIEQKCIRKKEKGIHKIAYRWGYNIQESK